MGSQTVGYEWLAESICYGNRVEEVGEDQVLVVQVTTPCSTSLRHMKVCLPPAFKGTTWLLGKHGCLVEASRSEINKPYEGRPFSPNVPRGIGLISHLLESTDASPIGTQLPESICLFFLLFLHMGLVLVRLTPGWLKRRAQGGE